MSVLEEIYRIENEANIRPRKIEFVLGDMMKELARALDEILERLGER